MISIQELTKNYGDVCAVDKMSLAIPEGQILGLLGPNGAGKSTTLRILTGYLPPSEGTIFVNGLDVRKESVEAKKLIGYLPESSPIYPDMLVHDYLEISTERDLRKDLYLAVKKRDWILLELIREKKSLENIFRILTSEGEQ